MNKAILAGAAVASFALLTACNAHAPGNQTGQSASGPSALNGTWKADINSVKFDTKPDELLLQNGTYSCKSCTPQYSVAADGAFHPINTPYADSDSVKVVDPHTVVETAKKNGKQVNETTYTVSADGNTLTGKFTDTSGPSAAQSGEFTESRVGPAAAGAHAISGQWKPTKLANFNDAALTVTLNVTGDDYQSTSPSGTSFDAKVGGGDVPVKGDIAGQTVSVTKLGDNSYQQTFKINGKAVTVVTLTVGADGKMSGTSENKENGSKTSWSSNKQS